MGFPTQRLRRLRNDETIRKMVRESNLTVDDFILPMFAVHGSKIKRPIEVLPGSYQLSVDMLVEEARIVKDLGIPAILLFGIPKEKALLADEAYSEDGIVQQAVRALKNEVPELIVITDSCTSVYTPHGYSGIVENGRLLNDRSLELLGKIVVAQAQAGADMVAPSAMLDGQIKTIRTALDGNGFINTAIMSYAAKYASCLYDPFFRQGDEPSVDYHVKKTHQMDVGNSDEAMREIELDIEEGADIIMIKPGLFYLDIVYRAKQEYGMPVAVYNVSGEFVMMTAAAQISQINRQELIMEALLSCKRAGADMIITYSAKEAAKLLGRRA
jgi:porphobilinogen synthase